MHDNFTFKSAMVQLKNLKCKKTQHYVIAKRTIKITKINLKLQYFKTVNKSG